MSFLYENKMHPICCFNFHDISTSCPSTLALSGDADLWQSHMHFCLCGRVIARMLCVSYYIYVLLLSE
jgi:hypothetical protein